MFAKNGKNILQFVRKIRKLFLFVTTQVAGNFRLFDMKGKNRSKP